MSKKVRVTYKASDGTIIGGEKNLLIESDDLIFALDGTSIDVASFQLEQPGHILLEDQYGLWNLNRENLIAIEEAEFDSLAE